jgi:hypothetical protein
MCIATSQTLLTRMSLRLGLVIALMVGLQSTSSAEGISIPRYRGPVSPPETLSFPGMHYVRLIYRCCGPVQGKSQLLTGEAIRTQAM